MDHVISNKETNLNNSGKNRGIWNYLMRIMMGSIVSPWHKLQHILGPNKSVVTKVSHHSLSDVLKNFKEVQNMRI
jgi:hypothetical protein